MAAKKEKKAAARADKGGKRGDSPPPPPAPSPVEAGPVGDALNRLRALMDNEDLAAGSIATVACSYANTALAAENLALQKRWDLELLRGMEDTLIGALLPVVRHWADYSPHEARRLMDLYDELKVEGHPAAEIFMHVLHRAIWPAAGG